MGNITIITRPRLHLLVGIPGAGKSTYAKTYSPNFISYDDILENIMASKTSNRPFLAASNEVESRIKKALKNGEDVYYDSLNLDRQQRARIIGICPPGTEIYAHIIWAPPAECAKRDANRERKVGKEQIYRYANTFEMPYYDEGIDVIDIIRPTSIHYDGPKEMYCKVSDKSKMFIEAAKSIADEVEYYDVRLALPNCKYGESISGDGRTDIGPGMNAWAAAAFLDNIEALWLISNQNVNMHSRQPHHITSFRVRSLELFQKCVQTVNDAIEQKQAEYNVPVDSSDGQ